MEIRGLEVWQSKFRQTDRDWKRVRTAFYLRYTHFQSKITNPTDTKLKTRFEKILNSNITSLELFLSYEMYKKKRVRNITIETIH